MGEWKHGLFGCFDNFGVCIITYFVPCVTAGQVAQAVGKSCFLYGCLSMCGCIGIYTTATVRGQLREQKGIEGTFMNDCLLHWFCPVCALCQEGQRVCFENCSRDANTNVITGSRAEKFKKEEAVWQLAWPDINHPKRED